MSKAFDSFLKRQAVALLKKAGPQMTSMMRKLASTPYPPASVPGGPPAMRSGNLLSSLEYDITVQESSATLRVGDLKGKVPYFRYLEFGTNKMAPRPLLRPVLHRFKKQLRHTTGSIV